MNHITTRTPTRQATSDDHRVLRGLFSATAVAVGIAVGAAGLSTTSSAPTQSSEYDDLPAIADYARANEHTGLSPASLGPIERMPIGYLEHPAIAEYARTNGLSGLSPSSLRPVEPTP